MVTDDTAFFLLIKLKYFNTLNQCMIFTQHTDLFVDTQ